LVVDFLRFFSAPTAKCGVKKYLLTGRRRTSAAEMGLPETDPQEGFFGEAGSGTPLERLRSCAE
jgi:hypothetical protein